MAKEDIETLDTPDLDEATEQFSDDISVAEVVPEKRLGSTRRHLEDLLEKKRLMRELEDPVRGFEEELADWQ